EESALGVERLHDPRTAWDFHRSVHDGRAALLRALRRGRDAVDAEIVVPEWARHLRRLFHHAAALDAVDGEGLIDAHRAHIHRLRLGPAEKLRVEIPFAIEIACIELMPADEARGHRRMRRRRLVAARLEDE